MKCGRPSAELSCVFTLVSTWTNGAPVCPGVVMSQRDIIDFSALEKELQAAVESERKYQRENQAKLRAVSQGVDYDQFRWITRKF